MGKMRTLDQERAEYAWKCAVRKRRDKEYENVSKAGPALIMSNGLMQTLAFYHQRKSDASLRLADDIREWLGKRCPGVPGEDFSAFMGSLHQCSSSQYMHATEEALEILRWIRHFATALSQ